MIEAFLRTRLQQQLYHVDICICSQAKWRGVRPNSSQSSSLLMSSASLKAIHARASQASLFQQVWCSSVFPPASSLVVKFLMLISLLSTHRNDPPSSLEYLRLSMSGHLRDLLICLRHIFQKSSLLCITRSTRLTISSNRRLSITETIIGDGRSKRCSFDGALVVVMANYLGK